MTQHARIPVWYGLLLGLLSVAACGPRTGPVGRPTQGVGQASDRTVDSLALLRLHAESRRAHLEKRADLLVAEWADDFVSISRGGVSSRDRERGRVDFQAYLDASTFQAWDDIVPPRIRISRDGQMAYVVVQKRVHLTARTPDGRTETVRTRFAWLSVYVKRDGQWNLAAIASTDRPDQS